MRVTSACASAAGASLTLSAPRNCRIAARSCAIRLIEDPSASAWPLISASLSPVSQLRGQRLRQVGLHAHTLGPFDHGDAVAQDLLLGHGQEAVDADRGEADKDRQAGEDHEDELQLGVETSGAHEVCISARSPCRNDPAGVRWQDVCRRASACVLVPHFKDEYWLSVAHGIERRAEQRGLEVRFFEAGGYRALPRQLAQLADCADLQPGAILIGAVSSDAPELLAAVAAAATRQPVIGLVNALHSEALAARIGVDSFEMGHKLGAHLATR